jgi:MoaA/NifB/PqqE/SkfB family radical SAM enzyme
METENITVVLEQQSNLHLGQTENDNTVKVNEIFCYPNLAPPLVKGIHKLVVGTLIRLNIIAIAIKHLHGPIKVIRVLKKLENLRRQYMGDFKIIKLMKVDGRYYWDMHAPGWPSSAFNKYNEGEMNRIYPFRKKTDYLNSMILAITKKCPLRCEHCYEWDVLNHEEKLSLIDLKKIVQNFQDRGRGVTQIQLSGGEPLSRFNDAIELIKSAKSGTDFWLITSGYKLTLEKARKLKNAGLRGVAISLDHFNPQKHNAFRGNNEVYKWVVKAVVNAHKSKLVVVMLLCPTKEFISEENMIQYARLSKKLGAAFILMIEPRAVGHYAEKDVAITKKQEKILEDFYIKMNYDPRYLDMPGVSYHGYHQRRVGCFGGGSRYLYVDTDGDMHLCPFCRQKFGNVLSSSINKSIEAMKEEGCHQFKNAEI